MRADAVGDAGHVTGDVAALHRQRTAIARDGADRVLGDFLDPQCGHEAPLPNSSWGSKYAGTSYFFVNYVRGRR